MDRSPYVIMHCLSSWFGSRKKVAVSQGHSSSLFQSVFLNRCSTLYGLNQHIDTRLELRVAYHSIELGDGCLIGWPPWLLRFTFRSDNCKD